MSHTAPCRLPRNSRLREVLLVILLWSTLFGPAKAEDSWCAHVAGGPSGRRAIAVDLSAAHGDARFFGALDKYSTADQALAQSLSPNGPIGESNASSYAEVLGCACFLAASDTPIGRVSVRMVGSVAVVTPGTGSLTLPGGTAAVAIDLRDLPAADGLASALRAAVAPALAATVAGPYRSIRKHYGLTDEVFTPRNAFANTVKEIEDKGLTGTGSKKYPLAVLTGRVMAPEAVEFAGLLRIARLAWIIGSDMPAAVAESRWHGVGKSGLAVRVADLKQSGKRWPDTIPADTVTSDPISELGSLPTRGTPPPMAWGSASRTAIQKTTPFQDVQPLTTGLGQARAALITAHAAARLFFPYFADVGDRIDGRLLETLSRAEKMTSFPRGDVRNLLRRFGEALSDGHNFVYDMDPASGATGCFPVVVDRLSDVPVIRRSAAQGVNPGDTITSIGGLSAKAWLAREYRRTSAATTGYRFDVAVREFLGISQPIDFGLLGVDGSARTVTVTPYPWSVSEQLGYAPSMRPAGWMSDYGASDVYYMNLDGGVLYQTADFDSQLRAASVARGLILDMRGYPGISHYAMAQKIIPARFSSPIFRVPVLTSPTTRAIDESSFPMDPVADPSYAGPVVLLVGPATVSAAENFSIMLVDAKRVTVVGRQSAGTNGNITGVQLPGGFTLSFTGMEILHIDHSRFHGIGMLPKVTVKPIPSDYAERFDRDLQAAVKVLKSQAP